MYRYGNYQQIWKQEREQSVCSEDNNMIMYKYKIHSIIWPVYDYLLLVMRGWLVQHSAYWKKYSMFTIFKNAQIEML